MPCLEITPATHDANSFLQESSAQYQHISANSPWKSPSESPLKYYTSPASHLQEPDLAKNTPQSLPLYRREKHPNSQTCTFLSGWRGYLLISLRIKKFFRVFLEFFEAGAGCLLAGSGFAGICFTFITDFWSTFFFLFSLFSFLHILPAVFSLHIWQIFLSPIYPLPFFTSLILFSSYFALWLLTVFCGSTSFTSGFELRMECFTSGYAIWLWQFQKHCLLQHWLFHIYFCNILDKEFSTDGTLKAGSNRNLE